MAPTDKSPPFPDDVVEQTARARFDYVYPPDRQPVNGTAHPKWDDPTTSGAQRRAREIAAMRAAPSTLPDHIPDAGKMVPPPGEGPSRESVARIIDPQAMSPGAVTSTGKPFAGSVRESDALRAADAILALFPPARPDGWRPPTEADQDGKPFIGWNGHVRQWVRWMEGAWRSSETAAPWVPTLIFDLPIPPQEETGRDDVCTDCGGTGTTYQTERPCACQVPPHEGGGKPS